MRVAVCWMPFFAKHHQTKQRYQSSQLAMNQQAVMEHLTGNNSTRFLSNQFEVAGIGSRVRDCQNRFQIEMPLVKSPTHDRTVSPLRHEPLNILHRRHTTRTDHGKGACFL